MCWIAERERERNRNHQASVTRTDSDSLLFANHHHRSPSSSSSSEEEECLQLPADWFSFSSRYARQCRTRHWHRHPRDRGRLCLAYSARQQAHSQKTTHQLHLRGGRMTHPPPLPPRQNRPKPSPATAHQPREESGQLHSKRHECRRRADASIAWIRDRRTTTR